MEGGGQGQGVGGTRGGVELVGVPEQGRGVDRDGACDQQVFAVHDESRGGPGAGHAVGACHGHGGDYGKAAKDAVEARGVDGDAPRRYLAFRHLGFFNLAS